MTERNRSIRRPPALEKNIQKSIVARLKKMGAKVWTSAPSPWGYNKGKLDITGIYLGMGFAFEVKRPGAKHELMSTRIPSVLGDILHCGHCWKEATPIQRAELESVRRAHGIAEIVTSADEAAFVLNWYDDRRTPFGP